jgi:hypothetical protein
MMANAAFLLGLTTALGPVVARLTTQLGFAEVQRNFYRSAQSGLEATLAWPLQGGVEYRRAGPLVHELLPLARQGLDRAGVDPKQSEELLGIIELRAASGQTGAAWQKRTVAALERRFGREEALSRMLERYMELSARGEPVHLWPVG